MPRLTTAQYMALLAKDPAHRSPQPVDGCDKEKDLHHQILDHCKRNNWLAFHGSMAHSTTRTLGEPDFVILMPAGRLLMVECKTRTGKLTIEQVGIQRWAEMLGHTIYVVRSYEDFLSVVNDLSH